MLELHVGVACLSLVLTATGSVLKTLAYVGSSSAIGRMLWSRAEVEEQSNRGVVV